MLEKNERKKRCVLLHRGGHMCGVWPRGCSPRDTKAKSESAAATTPTTGASKAATATPAAPSTTKAWTSESRATESPEAGSPKTGSPKATSEPTKAKAGSEAKWCLIRLGLVTYCSCLVATSFWPAKARVALRIVAMTFMMDA
eukprot:Blabericola_migrator_1__3504@NODE_203_length_11435_cov_141_633445_g174_i0_p7_GENE_NODE_203_length_11435_cov_141_633445_g174_i0NODE_203_length_11435_cov_141_633445_g174_i0_p7_ORF_typecomplete_len143_score20_02DUF5539/PF17693_1/0_047CDC27/PF09507_10/0_79Podoplanin/PF05808_11/1_6_NODE_203_length_11435_cov_141_633445_g174_i089089336